MSLLQTIFFLTAAALYGGLCFLNRRLATALFFGILPTYVVRFAVPLAAGFVLPTTLLEIFFIELFVAWLFGGGWRQSAETRRRWFWPLLLLQLAGLLAVAVAPDLRAALGLWRAYLLEPSLLFLIAATSLDDARYRRWALGALGLSLTVVALAAAYQKLTGFGIPFVWRFGPDRRVTSFYGYPNAVGLFAAPISALLAAWGAGLIRRLAGWKKPLSLLPLSAAALGAFAIVFAVSEGAAIGLAAAGLAFLVLWRPTRIAGLILTIAICLAALTVTPVRDYLSIQIFLQDSSGAIRRDIWSETTNMLAEHPIFGAGLSGYQRALEPYHRSLWLEIFQYPHNLVLNFWTELGLAGLAAFIWLVVIFFKDAAALAKSHPNDWLPIGLMAAVIAMLVHGLVDVPYFKNDLAMLFWLILALGESARLTGVESSKVES